RDRPHQGGHRAETGVGDRSAAGPADGKIRGVGMRKAWVVLAAMLASGGALAADTVKKDQSILDRLYANTGVYNKAAPGTRPGLAADPGWPAPLPHSWMLGQIGGLYVDSQDHIWVYNRPRTMTTDEAALETRGGSDGKNGLGFARPNGAVADC